MNKSELDKKYAEVKAEWDASDAATIKLATVNITNALLHYQTTGASLKEAKEFVLSIVDALNRERPFWDQLRIPTQTNA